MTVLFSFSLLFIERLGIRHLEGLFAGMVALMTLSFGAMFCIADIPYTEVGHWDLRYMSRCTSPGRCTGAQGPCGAEAALKRGHHSCGHAGCSHHAAQHLFAQRASKESASACGIVVSTCACNHSPRPHSWRSTRLLQNDGPLPTLVLNPQWRCFSHS